MPISALSAEEVWDGTFPAADENAAYSGGSGLQEDPYLISTAEDLAQLSVNTNEIPDYTVDKYFKQTADIILNSPDVFARDEKGYITGIAEGKTANAWTPIGNHFYFTNSFCGNYDGAGHAVRGIYIETEVDYQGLFGYINNGSVSRLGIEDSFIFGWSWVGGVIGYNDEALVKNSNNTGTVSGETYVGGVIGYSSFSVITSLYNSGAVSGNESIGGLVGYNHQTLLTNSYNNGEIYGADSIGGLVGYNFYSTVKSCYNIGSVSGETGVGGVVGKEEKSMVINTYYLSACVPDATNYSGTALSDSEMQLKESFAGFDFVNVWAIESSTGYAYPQLIINLDPNLGEPSAVWDGTVADGFAVGTGSKDDPYLIQTAEELAFLAFSVADGNTYYDKYFKLENDIVLNNTSAKYWILNASKWTPIG
ncbi:MAG: hypothetical protein GXY95_03475 [Clostridiales bacterium]|nr:hypothetical protein [Clostridiales bacterium]